LRQFSHKLLIKCPQEDFYSINVILNKHFFYSASFKQRKKEERKEGKKRGMEGREEIKRKKIFQKFVVLLYASFFINLPLSQKKKKKERKEMEENKEKCERTSLFHHLLLSISPFYPLNEEA
jgi:hypothetical protein